jgi:hypothetical protein
LALGALGFWAEWQRLAWRVSLAERHPDRNSDRCLKPRRARHLDQHLYRHPSGSWGLQRGRQRESHGDTPAFAGVTVWACDAIVYSRSTPLAVKCPPSAVRRPPSRVRCPALHVAHSAYGTLRTAFGLSHSARSAVRDTSAHRYRPNPWISPATPRRLPGSSPICTEIPPEATRETRRNSVQSPKIPLRPRTSMVDGG